MGGLLGGLVGFSIAAERAAPAVGARWPRGGRHDDPPSTSWSTGTFREPVRARRRRMQTLVLAGCRRRKALVGEGHKPVRLALRHRPRTSTTRLSTISPQLRSDAFSHPPSASRPPGLALLQDHTSRRPARWRAAPPKTAAARPAGRSAHQRRLRSGIAFAAVLRLLIGPLILAVPGLRGVAHTSTRIPTAAGARMSSGSRGSASPAVARGSPAGISAETCTALVSTNSTTNRRAISRMLRPC